MSKELWEAMIEEAQRWIAKQFTMTDPKDPRSAKDAQARIELVDHLQKTYLEKGTDVSIVEKLYWTKGVDHGRELERKAIIKMLEDYFALAQEPFDNGNTNDNPEWDRGFQAAMAIISNPYNHQNHNHKAENE
jgi:hypothetical protein